MQKVVAGVVVGWLLVVAGSISLVYSQPAVPTETGRPSTFRLGRDLSVTVGLDVWPNQWVKTVPNQFNPIRSVSSAGLTQSASSFGVAFIPNVTLTYERFFLSASYTVTPDYHFDALSPILLTFPNLQGDGRDFAGFVQARLRGSRQEGDLTIGYFPLNWLGVAIGYKGMFQDFDFKNRINFVLPSSVANDPNYQNLLFTTSSVKERYNGPVAGVLVSVPIDNSFTLTGNAFAGYLFSSCTTDFRTVDSSGRLEPTRTRSCSQADSPYTASKFVLRYAPTPQLAVTLGYRVQIVNNRVDVNVPPGTTTKVIRQTAIDLTHGPVFGVNYRF